MLTKFSTLLVAVASVSASKITTDVLNAAKYQGVASIMIEFQNGIEAVLDRTEIQSDDHDARAAFRQNLISNAEDSQKSVLKLLEEEHLEDGIVATTSFWINNSLFIENLSLELIERIAALPTVSAVRQQDVAQIQKPVVEDDAGANEWGIDIIRAPAVWENGNKGKGALVASIDTGVRATHEALKSTFRGAYGWFDPYDKTAAPVDNDGHGTHTMGSIAGSKGIGVAPDATWMACKGCSSDGCTEAALLACFQFITCPTDPQGKNADCTKAPQVVNNSWGSTNPSKVVYKPAVDALRKAGIIPVFSNGNSGPGCFTVGSPGSFTNVIGVGATGADDSLAYFSSKGPSPFGVIKPDISAPGYKIRSASNEKDDGYQVMSGTSMAAPHITGVVGLIKAANPKATYEDVYQLLISNADIDTLKKENLKCGNVSDAVYPNNNYGYGRVNVQRILPY